jgi:hypothetical protein
LLLQFAEMRYPISLSAIKVLISHIAGLIYKVIDVKHFKNIKASEKSVY